MGALSDIITAIEERMEVLGFKKTKEVFGFEGISDSVIDKSFRIGPPKMIENSYFPMNRANPKEEIEIWIAYKRLRDESKVQKQALDDKEKVESDLINAPSISSLSSDPLLMMNREATTQEFLENYLVSRLVFTCDYLRDLASS